MATVPKSVLHRIEVNKSRKVAAAEQFRSWQERWRSAPQREGVQHCTQEGCVKKGVYVSFRQDDGILFCRDCAHAAQQGLFARAWTRPGHPGLEQPIEAELIHAVPNDASSRILNQLGGAVALVQRGGVPFATKARHCQEAGALAVVIVDTPGQCDDQLHCGGLLGDPHQGPLGSADSQSLWQGVYIPVSLVSRRSGARMRALMTEEEVLLYEGQVHFHTRELDERNS